MASSYVLEYDGGALSAESVRFDIEEFAQTLRKFNGVKPWGLALSAVPDGVDYDQMLRAGEDFSAFLQAGGSADAMTLQIRKPGTHTGGAVSVLYVIGHPHEGDPPINIPIPLSNGAERVSAPEVFGADEAAELFMIYQETGDVPGHYTLRPLLGWTGDDTLIDYRDHD